MFLGEFEGAVMQDLVAKKIFSEYETNSNRVFSFSISRFYCRIKMVDFQGVCLRRQIRFEKSAGNIFRGVSFRQKYLFDKSISSFIFRSFK